MSIEVRQLLNILQLHSVYRQPGGEDQSCIEEAAALRERGHRVRVLALRSDSVQAPELALESLGLSLYPQTLLKTALDGEKPDIVHLQNTFPRWMGALPMLRELGIPIVASVRNFRIAGCMAGTLWRDGRDCGDCIIANSTWPGIKHGCYRGRFASTVAAASLRKARWRSGGIHFIAVSRFVREVMLSAGFDPSSIVIKPNCVRDSGIGSGDGGYALFVGDPQDRPEKGFALLAAAWVAAKLPQNRLMLAYNRPHDEVLDLMGRAAFVVVPSLWAEPFGRVVIEAFSKGTPVLATKGGGLQELVEEGVTGWLAKPEPDDLAHKLRRAFDEAPLLRVGARAAYEARYTPAENARQLEEIYAWAMSRSVMETAA